MTDGERTVLGLVAVGVLLILVVGLLWIVAGYTPNDAHKADENLQHRVECLEHERIWVNEECVTP